MYLLDTNVVSELRKAASGRASANLVAWASAISEAGQFISVVTLLELEIGVLLMERRDPVQGAPLRNWLENKVIPTFSGRILPMDEPVARQCARLHVPDPRPERDAQIAATAMVHRLTVVTRNVEDFAPMGVTVFNPWTALI